MDWVGGWLVVMEVLDFVLVVVDLKIFVCDIIILILEGEKGAKRS